MFCEEKKSPFTSAHMESHSWSHVLCMLRCVDSLAALVVEWGQKHCVAPASSAAGFVNAGTPSLEGKFLITTRYIYISCWNAGVNGRLLYLLILQWAGNLSNRLIKRQETGTWTHHLQLLKLVQKSHLLRVYW